MIDGRALLAIAHADFRERVRRDGFLVTIGFTLAAAYTFLPPNPARYATLQFDGHRGIYNSAWVGHLVAMLVTIFLSLTGFYVVKNAVERDRELGVGAILAATPMSKASYAFGKALSNLAVLATMGAVVMAGAAGMQLLRGEDRRIDVLQFVAPYLLLVLPALAVVATLAVLFEVTPGLRGVFGNVVFFLLWNAALAAGGIRRSGGGIDFSGFGWVIPSMEAACQRAFPDYDPGTSRMSMGLTFKAEGLWNLRTFVWEGPPVGAALVGARLAWVGLAVGLASAAALIFDRFDAAARGRESKRRRRSRDREARQGRGLDPAAAAVNDAIVAARRETADVHLPALGVKRDFGWLPWIRAELTVMTRGLHWAWWVVTAGLFLASWLAPLWAARQGVLAALWVWPLALWSPLGSRETRHRTDAILFSVPRPTTRRILAQWAAGATLTLALGAGVAIRLATAGEGEAVATLLAGALFVPALAVALGAWTGSGRLFDVLYLMLWYLGPLHHIPNLDYTGGFGASTRSAIVWALAALAGLGAALWGGARRARR